MTFWGWQKDYIYGIKLGGCPENIENVIKSEIDKNNKGMTLVIQPRVYFFWHMVRNFDNDSYMLHMVWNLMGGPNMLYMVLNY